MFLVACTTVPQTISETEAIGNAASVRGAITAQQEPVTQSISLYEAMARALKYNLDHSVSMMELDLANADYDLSRYDLLPSVVANGGYYGRSNEAGSSSRSLLSGRESLEPSTSTDRNVWSGDLTASWNVLDFGLSKIRSEQLADETLIYEERRRKAVIKIMEDVHRAYWRAVSSERLSNRLSALEGDVNQAFTQSRALYDSRKTAPMPALSYQRELNDIKSQAQSMSRTLNMAKMELASLMGLAPDQAFTLRTPTHNESPVRVAMSYDEMIDVALRNRPEVRETIYAKRIGEKEMKKAVLEALPSLEAFAGLDTSSNSFLYNKNWADYGVRASWNLLKVFGTSARKKKAAARLKLEEERGLAAAMAVMTQVGVSRKRYESLMEEYVTAQQGAQVQSDILNQVEALSKASSASRQTLVRERMNALVAEARRDTVHAEMKEAAAQIYSSLGYDPYGADIRGDEDIATIAASLETLWKQRSKAPGA
ncbi:MAG: TolC family protein [Acidiferrobacterales bacterium]|nr:TolC family protein [Acidiferrobacterales bacterium]